ncbi:MAG: TetR/AcrR family transcriptional regulator [Chloroflexota bacterium]
MQPTQLSRRERRKQKTNRNLKDATEALLVEEGFDHLTIQKITDRADLARATFYLHFKDVEEAVWAVLADHFTHLSTIMWQVDGQSLADRRFQKFVRVFDYLKANQALMLVLFGDKGHIKLLRRASAFMAAGLRSDIETGRVERISDLPIDFEAQFYAGAVMQIAAWWLQNGMQEEPEAISGMILTLVEGR